MDNETNKIVDEAIAAFSELMTEFIKRIHGKESDDKKFKEIIDRWTEAKSALEYKNINMSIETLDFHLSINQKYKAIPTKQKNEILKLNHQDLIFLKSLKIKIPSNW